MKKSLVIVFFLISISIFAQKDCEYSSNVKDSTGTYKSTKDYVMHEKSRFIKDGKWFYIDGIQKDV